MFHFHGHTPPPATISYTSKILADGSGKPVALLGTTFISVVFRNARLSTAAIESDPSKVVRYTGPTRLTPRYPLLRQLAVSGDYEAVLSFGLGLAAVAGLSRSTPADSASLVLDLWRTAPPTLLWPSTSTADARAFQHLADDGNHLWMLNANQVAGLYTRNVLGWPRGSVRAIDDHVFQIQGNAGFWAIITLTQPLGRAHTVWTIASVVTSTREPNLP